MKFCTWNDTFTRKIQFNPYVYLTCNVYNSSVPIDETYARLRNDILKQPFPFFHEMLILGFLFCYCLALYFSRTGWNCTICKTQL